jgi:integrase
LHLREIEALRDLYHDPSFVFSNEAGTPKNPPGCRQRNFAQLLKKAGLPYRRFCNLRHTRAKLLLSNGVHPIAERLVDDKVLKPQKLLPRYGFTEAGGVQDGFLHVPHLLDGPA